MIYPHLDLRVVSVLAGLWLILSHGFALARPALVKGWLRGFPRSKPLGVGLLAVDAVWALVVVATMDLGEFSPLRTGLLGAILVAAVLTVRFVDEFLAVRAMGLLLLLVAEPMVEAAFLRPEKWRLLLVGFAYVLAVLGMLWVGLPYMMRDQIDWMRKWKPGWTAAALAGVVYGVALAVCGARG